MVLVNLVQPYDDGPFANMITFKSNIFCRVKIWEDFFSILSKFMANIGQPCGKEQCLSFYEYLGSPPCTNTMSVK